MNTDNFKDKIEETKDEAVERLNEAREDVEDLAGDTMDMISHKGGEVGSKLHEWRKDTDQGIEDLKQTVDDEDLAKHLMEDEAD